MTRKEVASLKWEISGHRTEYWQIELSQATAISRLSNVGVQTVLQQQEETFKFIERKLFRLGNKRKGDKYLPPFPLH